MLRLFLGAACIGFAPIFVRLLPLAPTPIGFYRCGFATIFLMLYISATDRKNFRPLTWAFDVWKLILLAGALFAVDLFVWHRSVIYAGAGLGTILGNTQVFYVALVGVFFYKERITFKFISSVFMAFFGIYLLVSYRIFQGEEVNYSWGVFFGLLTGIIYASYILTIRKIESMANRPPTEQVLAMVSLVSAIGLFLISEGEGTMRMPAGIEWAHLIGLALVAQVFGWLLITRALPRTPVSRSGLILNAQPVVAVIASALILDERLGAIQLAGAALTLYAIYLGSHKVKKSK